MIYFLISIVIIIGIIEAKFFPEQSDNKTCSELFWERMPKIGTVYQDNNAYYEIIFVDTFGAAWREIQLAIYLKYQKSPVLYYTYTYTIPLDLTEIKLSDIENFKRIKANRLKDSKERFNLINKKWLNGELNMSDTAYSIFVKY